MAGTKEKRADRWVKQAFPFLTGRQVEEALESRLVQRSDGARVAKGDRFSSVDALDLTRLERQIEALKEGDPRLPVRVIQEEEDWVLLDKGAGVACHPLGLMDGGTVTHWAWAKYPDVVSRFPSPLSPLTPHRLDTGTSGALVLCKSPESYQQWREAFAGHQFSKTYLAWCWGKPAESHFAVDQPLSHDPRDRRRMAVDGNPPVLPARTEFRVKRELSEEGVCLLEAKCQTGATHQVRVHASLKGLPLVGDSLYDPEWSQRVYQPKTHWLRAVVIEKDKMRLKVGHKNFQKRLPSLIASAAQSKGAPPAQSEA